MLKTLSEKIVDIKTASKTLFFIQSNGITELPQLQGRVEEKRSRFNDVSKKLKTTERCLKTLEEHIWQAENY